MRRHGSAQTEVSGHFRPTKNGQTPCVSWFLVSPEIARHPPLRDLSSFWPFQVGCETARRLFLLVWGVWPFCYTGRARCRPAIVWSVALTCWRVVRRTTAVLTTTTARWRTMYQGKPARVSLIQTPDESFVLTRQPGGEDSTSGRDDRGAPGTPRVAASAVT